MASKKPETFTLTHPNGFDVTVAGAARAQTLLDRGYKPAKGTNAKATLAAAKAGATEEAEAEAEEAANETAAAEKPAKA